MASLPQSYKRLLVHTLSSDFRKAVRVETLPTNDLLKNLKSNEVLVKNHYVGINASDINYTAGRYDPRHKPPMVAGFESIGAVVAVGEDVKHLKAGSAVACMSYGAFSEFMAVPSHLLIPLPALKKEYLSLLVTGLTSSIALEQQGRMTKGETVLVTAAAGGAGQIAVRLAKLAGNTVIGTCSSDEKTAMLKELGCDRVINYKKEDLGTVLKKEYPKGINIVYESVGGSFLKAALDNLATRGRLIVIGSMGDYKTGPDTNKMADAMKGDVATYSLLVGSKTVAGFFLFNFASDYPRHLKTLITLFEKGDLKVFLDDKFRGIEGIYDAVDHLQAGKNIGKVVVSLLPESKL